MAGWGVLSGLGKGLENFGNEMSEQARQKAKEELAQKLELEREERAEARQVAREERQAARADATVTEYRPLRGSDGVTWMQGYNASGAPRGERRLANEQEIADFTRSQEENRIKLEDLVTRAEINKFKAGRLKTEAAQDDAEHEANMAYKRAATAAAGRRGMGNKDDDDSGVSSDIEDTVNGLVAQAKDAGVSMADISRLREQAQSMPTRGVRGTKWAPTPEEANRNFIRLLDEFIKTAQKTPESLIRRRPSALDEE